MRTGYGRTGLVDEYADACLTLIGRAAWEWVPRGWSATTWDVTD